MESRVQTLCDLKSVKMFIKKTGFDVRSLVIRKFLHGSKGFLKEYEEAADEEIGKSELLEWYSVLTSVLQAIHRYFVDCPGCAVPDLEMVLSVLNYILFYLIKIDEISTDWLSYLGNATLEFLTRYSRLESHKEDFAAAIAQKSFSFLCSVGQTFLKETKEHKHCLGDGYQLCLLGCAFSNLDTSKTEQSAPQMVRNFLSNYNQLSRPDEKSSSLSKAEIQQRTNICRHAVIVYCTRPCSLNENDCLLFVEIFRMSMNCPELLQRILDCDGNLFKLDLTKDNTFPCKEIVLLQKCMETKSQADLLKNINQLEVTLSICRYISCVKRVETIAERNSKENISRMSEIAEHFHQLSSHVESIVQSRTTKAPQLIVESLSLLVQHLPDVHCIPSSALLSYDGLLTLCMDFFARDTLAMASASKMIKGYAVNRHTYSLAVLSKNKMHVLQQLVARTDSNEDEFPSFATSLKSSLNSLCMLAQSTKKKALLAPDSSAYKQIFKTLSNAFTSIGTIGRQLRRNERHEAIITLLSPLWPIAGIPEFFPSLSHHETLCETFRTTGNVKAACQVISQAAFIDPSLVTSSLFKSLVKMAKADSNLNIPALFKNRRDLEGTDLLVHFIKIITINRSNAILAGHLEGLLRHVAPSVNLLRDCDGAVIDFLRGESYWRSYFLVKEKDKQDVMEKALTRIDRASKWFETDVKNYGDLLAQSLFLEAEIQHTLDCLSQTDLDKCNIAADVIDESQETDIAFDTVPDHLPDVRLEIAPQTPFGDNKLSTPKMDASFQTPTVAKPRTTSKIKPRKLNMDKAVVKSDTEESTSSSDTDLISRAHHCFVLWKTWSDHFSWQNYSSNSMSLKEKDEGFFRLERSLHFLQHLSQVAVVNHELVFAIECLSQAHALAHTMERTTSLPHLKACLLSLVTKLGLVSSRLGSEVGGEEEKATRAACDKEEVAKGLLATLEGEMARVADKGIQDEYVNVAPLAAHFYSANEIDKCLNILRTVIKRFEELKQKGPLTTSLSLAFGEMKRLSAEISSCPGIDETFRAFRHQAQYPLEAVAEAAKYVTSVAIFSMGSDFKTASGRNMYVNSWQLIHEYLSTVSLCSRLFRETGNMKYARTYLQEGLKVSHSCLLDSWRGKFLSALADLSLHGFDSFSEAQKFTNTGFGAVTSVIQIPQVDECSTSDILVENVLEDLLSLKDVGEQKCEIDCKMCALQTKAPQFSFNCDVMEASVKLLWTEAELAFQNARDKSRAIQLLHSAAKLSCHLSKSTIHKFVNTLTGTVDAKTSFNLKDASAYKLLLLESVLKISQVCFQALFFSVNQMDGKGSPHFCHEYEMEVLQIRKLCGAILSMGKAMGNIGKARIILASAQLLQIQLNCLPSWYKERNDFIDVEENIDEDSDLREMTKDLSIEEDYWDIERQRRLNPDFTLQPDKTPKTRYTRQASSFAPQQGEGSEGHEEGSPCPEDISQGPTNKHRSPLADVGNEDTSPAKSPKKSNIQGPIGKFEATTKTAQSEKSGKRTAGRKRLPRPLPILSLTPSHIIYTEEEDDDELKVNVMTKRDTEGKIPASQKKVKGTCKRQKGAAMKEQNSLTRLGTSEDGNVKGDCNAFELSPLSKELAQLSIDTAHEEAMEVATVRSKRKTCKPTDNPDCVLEGSKPVKRIGRGKKAVKDKNADETQAPLAEVSLPSKKEEIEGECKNARMKPDEDAARVGATSDVKNRTRKAKQAEKKDCAEPTGTRQRRRRKQSPDVASPEKKRQVDLQDEDDDLVFPADSEILPHVRVASPIFSFSDAHSDSAETDELWSDENPVERTSQSSKSISDVHSSVSLDISVEPILPLTADQAVDPFHCSVKPNLSSPVEIPRGRPRRVKQSKEETMAGTEMSPITLKNCKKAPPVRKNRKSIETARGIDDEEKENISTPIRFDTVKTPSSSAVVKSSRRAGTSKLSLKKKKPAIDKDTFDGEQLDQANRHVSQKKEVRKSADEMQSTPRPLSDEANSTIHVEGDDSLKSEDSAKSTRGQDNKGRIPSGEPVQKTSMKGRKEEVERSVEEDKEEKLSKNSRSFCNKCAVGGFATDRALEASADQDGRLTAKFLVALKDEQLEKDLWESIVALRAFPPSYLYSQLCKWMALCQWNRMVQSQDGGNVRKGVPGKQTLVAALLTESQHVSFQHMLKRNLHHKLRRCSTNTNIPGNNKRPKKGSKMEEKQCQWQALNREEVEAEVSILRQVLDKDQWDERIEETFQSRLQNIPEGWTVVQVSLLNFDARHNQGAQILITRMTSDLRPLTVGVPVNRWKDLKRLLHVCKNAVKYDVSEDDPEKYWTCRYKRNQQMQELVYLLQEQILCGHKWLLCGRPRYVNEKIQAVLDSAVKEAQEELREEGVDMQAVRVVLEVLLSANEKDMSTLLQCLWPSRIADIVAKFVWEAQAEVRQLEPESQVQAMERKPVVLVLDKLFNQLPWESMPILSEDTVTRVPSLGALDSLLTLHRQRPDSPFQTGVSRHNAVAVIDPEINLQNSVNVLKPQFEKYNGWACLTQQAPTFADLMSFLTHDLYIYNGHGWGRKFVGGDDLQMFRARSVAVIMGCYSGNMEFKCQTDGDGPPLYFLLAGCPTVVGNLWLVTDKDIDRFTSHVMSYWMSRQGPTSLSHILNQSRKVCKLQGLNGFAPVIYGLPVTMN